MEVKIGIRVVRGPDWKWGNQDGGNGHVGTVVEVRTADTPSEGLVASRAVLVQWDNGNRCNYRCGIEGKYDLMLYDNGPVAVSHPNIICDSCRESGIQGMRWKCIKCFDFDLCTSCYMSGKHDLQHEFIRQDSPESPRVRLPARGTSSRVLAKGLFKDAEVARGQDWIWGDQDGGEGSIGRLAEIKGWEKDTFRSIAEVEWGQSSKRNVYRVGHKGKMDLKVTKPGEGWLYFPDHLPILGKAIEESPVDSKPDIHSGDLVRVQLDVELFKAMQEGHGGWNDQLVEIIAQVGTVHTVLDSGDIRVRYPNNRTWTLNPASVTKVTQHSVGDVIKILDDISMVHNLQDGHGGWVDDMALALGQAGRVVKVFPTGDVRVAVNGRVWTFNPLCMVPAPGENPPEFSPEDDDMGIPDDMNVHLRLLSLLENPAVVVAAAAAGDVSTLKEFLTKHPKEVNTKAAGKSALHCASVAGNIAILKCLLEFDPDLEIEDEEGDRPLHLCAYGDEDESAKLLLDHNADVNGRNGRGSTPLIISAAKGHISVIKVLVQHKNIELHLQDQDGDTALHCAVMGQKYEAVSILLEAGADPELINFRLFTPIHEAARIGFLPALEQFMKKIPTCVNMPKDDGYTPLHLTALNDHLDSLTTILDCETTNIDSRTNEDQTPLHIAVHQGHARIVERLVGFGANLNAQDHDGDTPLHIAMMRETIDVLSVDTPQMEKMRKNFRLEGDGTDHTSAVMACFLVQEGANLYISNKKGNTPLVICSPDIATLVTRFIDQHLPEKSKFHGSLRNAGSVQILTPSNVPPLASGVTPTSDKLSPQTTQNDTQQKHLNPSSSFPPEKSRQPHRFNSEPTTSPSVECLLCCGGVDIRLKPCGHIVICRECSKRAKRCPTCKEMVISIEDITPKCLMCEEEDALVTVLPCKHMFCPACSQRMKKKCAECKSTIESKIGMPDIPQDTTTPSPSSTGTFSPTNVCEICCENPRNTALTCGHQFCTDCSKKVDNCPICRKFIQHRIMLFQ